MQVPALQPQCACPYLPMRAYFLSNSLRSNDKKLIRFTCTAMLKFCLYCRYGVFLQCWNEHADKRPSFSDLVMEISKLLEEIAGYIDFSSISANRPQDENSYVKNLHGDDHLAGRNKNN